MAAPILKLERYRLAWPLRKDDTQIREVFHIKKKRKKERKYTWSQDAPSTDQLSNLKSEKALTK